ncbi:permease [Helicobacter burdigaliensis]|uniref:permease n=1 Tax=Helicobacter burdigaliensis TaxID=2315334 RepID=UPI001E5A42C4|nr:permease [Helicobacter burdigaliensis]
MEVKLLESLKLFCIYFIELSLLFIFISAIVSFINHKYKNAFEKHLSKDSYSSYLKAILLGALTPFCSCSTIPLLRALLQANVAFGVCIAYLFTSPLINPIIVVMLFLAFSFKLTFLYVAFLFVAIFIFAILIQRLDTQKFFKEDFKSTNSLSFSVKKQAKNPAKITSFSIKKPQSCCGESKSKSTSCCDSTLKNKLSFKEILLQSFKDYKKLIPYIAIGMGIGAFIHGFVPQDFLQDYLSDFGILSVILAALIGILLYIRVEAIIPIGLALLEVGVNEGVIFSFLIAGAGCSLPELILLKGIFRTNFLALFVGLILLIAIGFGSLTYFL